MDEQGFAQLSVLGEKMCASHVCIIPCASVDFQCNYATSTMYLHDRRSDTTHAEHTSFLHRVSTGWSTILLHCRSPSGTTVDGKKRERDRADDTLNEGRVVRKSLDWTESGHGRP